MVYIDLTKMQLLRSNLVFSVVVCICMYVCACVLRTSIRPLACSQEDATRFGGQKKVVRRGDKDNHFVGYTYKRKPTVNTRPSVAGSASASASGSAAGAGARAGGSASAGGIEAGQGAGGGAAAAAAVGAAGSESGKATPTSGKTSPNSDKSSSPSGAGTAATRKSGGKKSAFGLFGGRKGV